MALTFPKRVLFYGLLTLLTLLTMEGMARIAYYAAYGQWYGSASPDTPVDSHALPPPPITADSARSLLPLLIRHPFYGDTRTSPYHDLNAMPPWRRREDTVVIGLLGGSVAELVKPYLERALRRYFAANNLPRQPVVLELAAEAVKQPQQTIIIANTMLLGGEFDLIVNLDGYNELAGSVGRNFGEGSFPFFPLWWHKRVGLTTEEILLAGNARFLRREQARLAAAGAIAPLRWSAAFGLVNRYRQERTAAQIIQRNRELAATQATYRLEQHGPRGWLQAEREALPAAARVWYRSSVTLARLAELGGAEYYHFLQPNQYVPGAKPLSAKELESAYDPLSPDKFPVEKGYPLLKQFQQDLQNQGVNSFDLTGIFADHPETLYTDTCCHLNDRGNELLAAAMVQRLEPALLSRGGASPAVPVSALAAARRPPEPDTLLFAADFQVYRYHQGGGQWLRYVREDCAPQHTEPRFFLHLKPRDLADLPPQHRESGFDNRDFSFAEAAGRRWRGQCRLRFRLPDYPIAHLRTGQYTADAGEIWSGGFDFPE